MPLLSPLLYLSNVTSYWFCVPCSCYYEPYMAHDEPVLGSSLGLSDWLSHHLQRRPAILRSSVGLQHCVGQRTSCTKLRPWRFHPSGGRLGPPAARSGCLPTRLESTSHDTWHGTWHMAWHIARHMAWHVASHHLDVQ